MILTVHQPEHLVWLGLLDKIDQAEKFVVLDSVPFRKNYFQNRNKIRTWSGSDWVSIPVQKHSLTTPICHIKISGDLWKDSVLGKIRASYLKAPFFKIYFPELEQIYMGAGFSLEALNIELLKFACGVFNITTPMLLARDYPDFFNEGKSELIVLINKTLGAHTYVAGPSGRDYLRLIDFKNVGIEVKFHNFQCPEYTQIHGSFIPNLSFIDLLFNHGPASVGILKNNRHKLLDE